MVSEASQEGSSRWWDLTRSFDCIAVPRTMRWSAMLAGKLKAVAAGRMGQLKPRLHGFNLESWLQAGKISGF